MPPSATLADLASAAAGCRACPLWEHASQTVFGTGPATATATATVMLVGDRDFRVSRDRGRFVPSTLAPRVLATVHPSSILRTDEAERAAALEGLVDDLAVVAAVLA